MKELAFKKLQLSPWDLCVLLHNAGVIKEMPCHPDVQIIERTEINKGNTILISWTVPEVDLPSPEIKKDEETPA